MNEATQQSKRISDPVIGALIALVSSIAVFGLFWMFGAPKGWIPRWVAMGIVSATWGVAWFAKDWPRLAAVLFGVVGGVLAYVQ